MIKLKPFATHGTEILFGYMCLVIGLLWGVNIQIKNRCWKCIRSVCVRACVVFVSCCVSIYSIAQQFCRKTQAGPKCAPIAKWSKLYGIDRQNMINNTFWVISFSLSLSFLLCLSNGYTRRYDTMGGNIYRNIITWIIVILGVHLRFYPQFRFVSCFIHCLTFTWRTASSCSSIRNKYI